MNPYNLQRRAESYIEDSSLVPLIHRCINEAISFVCSSNEPGKDWSFLEDHRSFPVESFGSYGVASLPSDVRSVIYVVDNVRYKTRVEGRKIIVNPLAGSSFLPPSVDVFVFRSHPKVLPSEGDYDTDWTPSNPPDSLILLPDEAEDLVIYKTLQLLSVAEIEVATNINALGGLIEQGIASLRANYSYQNDNRAPVDATQEHGEALTVQWLVDIGRSICGSARDTFQLVRLVNLAASDIADALRLRASERPNPVHNLNETLPWFGKPSTQSMSGPNEVSPIPSAYWESAMKYECLRTIRQLDQNGFQEYTNSMSALADLFYSLKTDGDFGMDTFGGMLDYLRSIWKSQRDDAVLWSALNQSIYDVMLAVNTGDTLVEHSLVSPEGSERTEFPLPLDFKVCVQVFLNGLEVICRGYAERGVPFPENTVWQFPRDPHGYCHGQFYSIKGRNLCFKFPVRPGTKITLRYYPKHVWPDRHNPSTNRLPIPVDHSLLVKALEARVALEQGDSAKYRILKDDFMQSVELYNESQNRSLGEDNKFIPAVAPVDHIIAVENNWWR